MKGARAAKEVKGCGGDMGQEPTTGFQILRQQKSLIHCHLNLLPHFLQMRLLIFPPRYFLHEGHRQLKALKPIKAAKMTNSTANIVFFENSPRNSGRL